MRTPGLHVVTNDEVLADSRFPDRAGALLRAHGPDLALHLRGPRTPVRRLLDLARAIRQPASESGALLLVNDRVDVALAAAADGVQLGARSIPVAAARSIRQDWVIGASVHDPDELPTAAGSDFVLVGTIWATASHPGREGAGLDRVRDVHRRTDRPIIAIGGVTPSRAAEARSAGAHGVAVIRGVWDAGDPVEAAGSYLERLGAADPTHNEDVR